MIIVRSENVLYKREVIENNKLLREEVRKLREENKRLNNKLELISTLVEREFPPNEFITYKMKKILRGVDKE